MINYNAVVIALLIMVLPAAPALATNITPTSQGPTIGSNVFTTTFSGTFYIFTWVNATDVNVTNSGNGNFYFASFPSGTDVLITLNGWLSYKTIISSSNQTASTTPAAGSTITILVPNQSEATALTTPASFMPDVLSSYFSAVGGPQMFVSIVWLVGLGAIFARTKSMALIATIMIVTGPVLVGFWLPDLATFLGVVWALGIGFLLYRIVRKAEY
jgi:hypothetical protein